ncbi:hypothetical protein F5B21DRAFT_72015 [Xylaria acuta]|nr:hypothetical protein F5B21DRAFT_72015 [Xylaria acuta]
MYLKYFIPARPIFPYPSDCLSGYPCTCLPCRPEVAHPRVYLPLGAQSRMALLPACLPTPHVHVPCHSCTSLSCTCLYLPRYICTWPWNSFGAPFFILAGPPLSNRVGCAMLDAVSQRLVPAMYLPHIEFLSHTAFLACLSVPIALVNERKGKSTGTNTQAAISFTYSLLLIHTLPVNAHSFQFHLTIISRLLFLNLGPKPWPSHPVHLLGFLAHLKLFS